MNIDSNDFKPCPHEILFIQLTQLEFNKFLEVNAKKRSMAFLKDVAFNGDMFRKPNKYGFQSVAFFLTLKVAQLTKKSKWIESIKIPSTSHEEEATFRRNFTELIESIEKDTSFSTCKLPGMRAQLLQCYGDQLVLLFCKVASFILLRQVPRLAKEKILQITLPNISCHDSNIQFIATAKECLSLYEKVKGDLNQELSNSLEASHMLKSAFTQAKSDYDELKVQVERLESQLVKKCSSLDEEKLHGHLQMLSRKINEKQASIRLLIDDENCPSSLASLTPDSLATGECHFADDTFSLLDTWKNLLNIKYKLDQQLKSVSSRQLLQLKERASESLSRLSQHKVQAEENLSALTLMACKLKSLVNKQKIQVESSQEFKKRKLQAATFLAMERLPVMKFNDETSTLNGERVWHCLIKQLEDYTSDTATCFTNNNCHSNESQLNNNRHRIYSNLDSSLSDVLANLSIDISRFNFTFNSALASDNNNRTSDVSVTNGSAKLPFMSDSSHCIGSNENSINEANKSLLTDQSAVFADSVFL